MTDSDINDIIPYFKETLMNDLLFPTISDELEAALDKATVALNSDNMNDLLKWVVKYDPSAFQKDCGADQIYYASISDGLFLPNTPEDLQIRMTHGGYEWKYSPALTKALNQLCQQKKLTRMQGLKELKEQSPQSFDLTILADVIAFKLAK